MAEPKAPVSNKPLSEGMRMNLDGVDGFGWYVHKIEGDNVIFTKRVGDRFVDEVRDRKQAEALLQRNVLLHNSGGRFKDLTENSIADRIGAPLQENELPLLGRVKIRILATDGTGRGKYYISAEGGDVTEAKAWVDAELLKKIKTTQTPGDIALIAQQLRLEPYRLGVKPPEAAEAEKAKAEKAKEKKPAEKAPAAAAAAKPAEKEETVIVSPEAYAAEEEPETVSETLEEMRSVERRPDFKEAARQNTYAALVLNTANPSEIPPLISAMSSGAPAPINELPSKIRASVVENSLKETPNVPEAMRPTAKPTGAPAAAGKVRPSERARGPLGAALKIVQKVLPKGLSAQMDAAIDVYDKELGELYGRREGYKEERKTLKNRVDHFQKRKLEVESQGGPDMDVRLVYIQNQLSQAQMMLNRLELNEQATDSRIGEDERRKNELTQLQEETGGGGTVSAETASQINALLPQQMKAGGAPAVIPTPRPAAPGVVIGEGPAADAARMAAINRIQQQAAARRTLGQVIPWASGSEPLPSTSLEPSTLSDEYAELPDTSEVVLGRDDNVNPPRRPSPSIPEVPRKEGEEDVTMKEDIERKNATVAQLLGPALAAGALIGAAGAPTAGVSAQAEESQPGLPPEARQEIANEEQRLWMEQIASQQQQAIKDRAGQETVAQAVRQQQVGKEMKKKKLKELQKIWRLINGVDVAHGLEDILGLILVVVFLDVQFINKLTFKNPNIPPTEYPLEDCLVIFMNCCLAFSCCLTSVVAFVLIFGPALAMYGALQGVWSGIGTVWSMLRG